MVDGEDDRLRLDLAPSDLPSPIPASASGDLKYPLTRGDSRLRKVVKSECGIRIAETKTQKGVVEARTEAGGQRSEVDGQKTERRVFVNEAARGSVASRDRMIREAKGQLVLALDDDSYPEQMSCLETFAKVIEGRSRLAVASFPQRTEEYPETLRQTDFGPEKPVRLFTSSRACLRVSAYRSWPSFDLMFFHMCEGPIFMLVN